MNTSTLDRPVAVMQGTGVGGAPSVSAVSWGAIFAGGVAAAAMSLILLVLGVGLGFTAASPWSQAGMTAPTFGLSSAIWLAVTALFASGIGGYVAGRLRTKWADTHVDEVHFRDTAHGFVAWSVATLATAGVLTSGVGAVIGSSVQAGAAVTGAGAVTAMATRPASNDNVPGGLGYFTDSLFRSSNATQSPVDPAEVTRIFVQGLRSGALSPDDSRYVAQVVAQKTGLSPQEAQQRVNDTFARAKSVADEAATKTKETADQARKVAAYAALWIVVSLLIGAFSASFAATLGGRQRDT